MPPLFKDPRYRAYWFSLFLSQLGGWVQATALGWLVLELTGSAERLGLLLALMFLPSLVLTLPGGALADRYPRAALLFVFEGLLLLFSALLAAGLFLGMVGFSHLVVYALLVGAVSALEVPTRQSLTAELAGRRRVGEALALNALAFNVARMAAPVLSGYLIAALSTAAAFLLNALSYLPLVAFLARLPKNPPSKKRGPILKELLAGIDYARRVLLLRELLLFVFLVATFGINFQTLIPAYARLVLGLGPKGYGFLMGSLGAGALLGALVLLRSPLARPRRSLFGALLLGASLSLLALVRDEILAALFLAAAGAAMVVVLTGANTTIQTLVSEEMRGRVVALYSLVLLGSGPPGMYLTGLFFDLFGGLAPLLLGALVLLLALFFLTRPWPRRVVPV